MADQTVNIPQLLLIILLGGLAARYFFFGATAEGPGGVHAGRTSAQNVRAREADVERVQQMFPQVPRRSIMWDLQRNGGNVVATTERVLSGRGLEVVSSLPILWEFPDLC
jgi:coupling of ubiquitin conjugation to ER degradation protein 1